MPKSSRRQQNPASRDNLARTRELTTKRRGELAELAFTLKAARLALGVARPFGDSERYDAIIDARDVRLNPKHRCNPECPTIQAAQSKKAAKQIQAREDARARADGSPAARAKRALPSLSLCGDGLCADGRIRPSSKAKRANRSPNREPILAGGRTCPALRALGQTSARQPWCPPQPLPPLWRVQVKCSTQLTDGLYHLNAHSRTGGRAVPYLPGEIDFLAAYIIPEDTWYIIPLEAFLGSTTLLFRRHTDRRPGLYQEYNEAWHLLRPK
jgi:hypothetical protein